MGFVVCACGAFVTLPPLSFGAGTPRDTESPDSMLVKPTPRVAAVKELYCPRRNDYGTNSVKGGSVILKTSFFTDIGSFQNNSINLSCKEAKA